MKDYHTYIFIKFNFFIHTFPEWRLLHSKIDCNPIHECVTPVYRLGERDMYFGTTDVEYGFESVT